MENLNNINLSANLYSLGVVIFYFAALFYVGYLGFKKTKSFSDYIIGGRKLGAIVGALNVGASDMSSWLLMGLPGAFYLFGLNQIWMVLGLIMGSFLSWSLIAVRLRKYSEIKNSLTISQFLENRFDDKSKILSLVVSSIIIFFFTIYIASGFVGGAKLFSQFLNISYHKALFISCFVIIFYAILGGFLAVSWADLFQGLLMLFVLLITPIFASIKLDFSLLDYISKIKSASESHLDIFHNLDVLSVMGLLSWGLGYFGQPHIISKYMAIKNEQEIRSAKKICITWMTLSMLGAAMVGMLGFVYFLETPLKEPETVFILISSAFFHPIFIGIFIAAILAAIMSTINAQIIICSSALVQDFYQRFWRKKAQDKELILASRLFLLLVALIALVIAWNENSSVLKLVARAWAGLGASIGPVIIFSLFYKKTTKLAAILGVISGAIGALIFSKINFCSYEILPAFILSSLIIFIVSLLEGGVVSKVVDKEFKKII